MTAAPCLPRLFQLASPVWPVGAYSDLQSLEAAIELVWVRDEATVLAWLRDQLVLGMGRCEAPLWLRFYDAGDARGDAVNMTAAAAAEIPMTRSARFGRPPRS